MQDKEGYWFNELDSLGIHAKRKNELNDREEMRDLVENVNMSCFRNTGAPTLNNHSYSSSSSSSEPDDGP